MFSDRPGLEPRAWDPSRSVVFRRPSVLSAVVRRERAYPVLIDPSEVPHPDTDGPAHISAPPTIGPPPRLQGASVPDAVDKNLNELRWRYLDEGHDPMLR